MGPDFLAKCVIRWPGNVNRVLTPDPAADTLAAMAKPMKLSLTLAAANWIVKQNRDYASLASWDVATSGWPPTTVGDPIYVAIIPTDLLAVPMGAEVWAHTMQRRFDPQDERDWVFVPGLIDDEVWLVHTKRVPTALN